MAVTIGTELTSWELAAEVPVQITVNGLPFTVMLATPTDLEDLARGLLLTEQVVADAHGIERIDVASWLHDVQVQVHVAADSLRTDRLGARTVLGNSGCGVCGVESLAHLHARSARSASKRTLPADEAIADEAIARAFGALRRHQPLNARTHSVHAAAWCDTSGRILLTREDVGRHNALDKLVGALSHAGRMNEVGFVVMSSRCSYELVYKTAATNARLLATISAPTTMALAWGEQLGVPVVSALRRGDQLDIVRYPVQHSPSRE